MGHRESTARTLLLVDNDPSFRQEAASYLKGRGYQVAQAECAGEALDLAAEQQFDVATMDWGLPDMDGRELLRQLRGDSLREVVVLSNDGRIESAVQAMKLGAQDFLAKPVSFTRLESALSAAQKRGRRATLAAGLQAGSGADAAAPPTAPPRRPSPADRRMLGESSPMRELRRLIARVGPTEKPVLIQGESGTGKELVARALHRASSRAAQPLIVVNCAALPETLLESELFGHEKGSFTGATQTKTGLFEVADRGTLFIDEVGEMGPSLQAKLLRVLEDGSLRPVGAITERRVDVRILTATNRDLAQEVREGRFREDLYYRIDVLRLQLPPLRERQEDILLLAHHFAGQGWSIEPQAMQAIQRYPWPGNIRQLSNAIERAKILADDHCVSFRNLPPNVARCCVQQPAAVPPVGSEGLSLDEMKRRQIEFVMAREQGNKVRAARALGVSRRSLYRLIEKYGITSR